ncbi:hypothetical protein [Halobaculum limi]|uniref:hypothetical protein n=1 Tax=Halobaculum limi TaxID=3031916 RepID=UPI0024072E2E|nr:hypothetical protein [Halobaculum sp. YSMS11]
MPSTESDDGDQIDSDRPDDLDRTDLTAEEVERIARRVAREEFDRRSRPSLLTPLAGALVGFTVLLPLLGLVTVTLLDAGVPIQVVAVAALVAAGALVAYGWRLPPFR